MNKKIILALALTSATASVAASSNIYDLMYLPARGTFAGESEFKYSATDYAIDYNGAHVAQVSSYEAVLNQSLAYAIGAQTIIGLSEEFQIDGKGETKYGVASTQNGTITKSKGSSGFSEPTIFLKQRVLEQSSGNVSIDFQGSFSPKLSDAQSSSTTKSGNNLRGGTQFEAQFEVGKKNENAQWKLQANYLLRGSFKSKSASDSSDITESDSIGVFGTAYSYQWNLAPNYKLNLLAAVAFAGEHEERNAHDHTKDVIDSSTNLVIGPSLILNLSDKAMVNLTVNYLTVDDPAIRDTDTSNNVVTILSRNDNSIWNLSAMVRYEF